MSNAGGIKGSMVSTGRNGLMDHSDAGFTRKELGRNLTAQSKRAVLTCEALTKAYQAGPEKIQVLQNINLAVSSGDWIAVVGSSGSGKSTLLNLVGTLDNPTSGRVLLAGQDVQKLKPNALDRLRNRHLGFVYQFHHLLPEFTALDNVAMPLMISGIRRAKARLAASPWLEAVGLSHRAAHKPAELSGGERQRAAIARALVMKPDLVLMDEPTGNLDRHTALAIQALIHNLSQEHGIAFIVVTHDLAFAQQAQRVLELNEGRLTLRTEL